jgi:hypothetical protein
VVKVKFEVIAGGPWLGWTTWDQYGRAVEDVTLDTMSVTSIHSRYDGVTRVITTTSVLLVHETISQVTRWVIAARRGLAHADEVYAEDVPHPEAIEKGVYTDGPSPDPT